MERFKRVIALLLSPRSPLECPPAWARASLAKATVRKGALGVMAPRWLFVSGHAFLVQKCFLSRATTSQVCDSLP